MKKFILIISTMLIAFSSCSAQKYKYYKTIMSKEEYKNLEDGLYANFQTTEGDMLVKLYEKEAPLTVANFVGLAEGTKENKAKAAGEPFYDGTIFHRIIKGFMIQGGDPQGTGAGDPGYKFLDEKNDLKHDTIGMLSMANSGPNTNGSQFFITEVPTPWLDGKHTLFGQVVEGLETVEALSNVKTKPGDKPETDVVLEKVTIVRKGDAYKKYNGGEQFAIEEPLVKDKIAKYEAEQKEKAEKAKKEAEAKMAKMKEGAIKTESGLEYKVTQATEGAMPKKGDNLSVHYTGMLEDGTVFDSSYSRNEPIQFAADTGRMIKGWDEGIMLLKEGEKAIFFIPSELAYGARGAGGVIPPNANIIFELELVKIN